jgi:outer membrane protein assembly factor BamB
MKTCCLFLALASLALGASVRADDWPLPRHDAANTAYTAQRLAPPLRLAWRVPTHLGAGGLMASSGVVCVADTPFASYHPQTSLLRSSDGALVWRLDDADPVYLHGHQWLVAARTPRGDTLDSYDWKTHRKQWSYPLGGPFVTAREDEGKIYCCFGGISPSVVVLSLDTGRKVQIGAGTGENIVGQIAAGDGNLLIGAGHWLDVLDPATMVTRVGFYDGGTLPLLDGRYAVTQGWGHWAQGIDVEAERVVWGISAWRDAANSLVKGTGGKMLVLESTPNPPTIEALDVPTGKGTWRRDLVVGGYGVHGWTAGTGNVAYVPGGHINVPGGPRGGFYALDGVSGRVLWKYEKPGVSGTEVIVREGALYGLDAKGFLYKFVR